MCTSHAREQFFGVKLRVVLLADVHTTMLFASMDLLLLLSFRHQDAVLPTISGLAMEQLPRVIAHNIQRFTAAATLCQAPGCSAAAHIRSGNGAAATHQYSEHALLLLLLLLLPPLRHQDAVLPTISGVAMERLDPCTPRQCSQHALLLLLLSSGTKMLCCRPY
jgi:hypothetical protein